MRLQVTKDFLMRIETASCRPAIKLVRSGILLLAIHLSACASFQPGSITDLNLRERATTQSRGGITASVAVLSRDEAAQLFGAELHRRGIQPVWLELRNDTDRTLWLMLNGLDPSYFSAREAAYMNHKSFAGKANREMDYWFSSVGINQLLMPGETNSGFAFSNETLGTKEVRVQLQSDRATEQFDFFVSVPGLVSEWDRKDLVNLYPDASYLDVQSEAELQNAIEKLPCCTQKENGTGSGEPLNVVFVGGEQVIGALITAGWDETVFRTTIQTLIGDAYLFGRTPDIQFEKSRGRTASKSLLRLWVSPIRYKGQSVSIGSIKRDIDPNTDAAAMYLLEDLVASGKIERFGVAGGVPPVDRATPRRTLANDPYWTRGQRIVVEVSEATRALSELDTFSWQWQGSGVFKESSGVDDTAGAAE